MTTMTIIMIRKNVCVFNVVYKNQIASSHNVTHVVAKLLLKSRKSLFTRVVYGFNSELT